MATYEDDFIAQAAKLVLPILLAALAEAPATAPIVQRVKVVSLATIADIDREARADSEDVGESVNTFHAAVEALFSAKLPPK